MRSAGRECHEDAGGVYTLNNANTSAAYYPYEQGNRSFACRGQDYSECLTVTYLPQHHRDVLLNCYRVHSSITVHINPVDQDKRADRRKQCQL